MHERGSRRLRGPPAHDMVQFMVEGRTQMSARNFDHALAACRIHRPAHMIRGESTTDLSHFGDDVAPGSYAEPHARGQRWQMPPHVDIHGVTDAPNCHALIPGKGMLAGRFELDPDHAIGSDGWRRTPSHGWRSAGGVHAVAKRWIRRSPSSEARAAANHGPPKAVYARSLVHLGQPLDTARAVTSPRRMRPPPRHPWLSLQP